MIGKNVSEAATQTVSGLRFSIEEEVCQTLVNQVKFAQNVGTSSM